MESPGLILAIGLAFIHAFVSQLNIFKFIPQHRWLSFAGGISIGYVFLEVFPELSHAQEELQHSAMLLLAYLENHVYILALLGLLIFYGLDILAINARAKSPVTTNADGSSSAVYWIHIAGFATLNFIFGYLLQDIGRHGLLECILFFVAVALHFFVIDQNLREHYARPYDQSGRWILTAAIMVGAVIGQATHFNEAAIAIVWSFMAGSVILNVLKRELPDENQSCYLSFIGGTAIYAALILLA